MTIRHAVAALGVLVGAGLAAPAQDPPEPSKVTVDALAAAGAAARGATLANVVPGGFRAHLVIDNRFLIDNKLPPFKCDAEKRDLTKVVPPVERDARDRTGKIHDLVGEYGLSPTVAIFVRADLKGADAGGGLGKLVASVNKQAIDRRGDKLSAFLMYLKVVDEERTLKSVKLKDEREVTVDKEYPDDEKRDKFADELCLFAQALGENAQRVPFGLAPVKSEAISRFAIGETTPVTVIIYNRLRMVQRWDLTVDQVEGKVDEIREATDRMMGIEPKKK